MQSIDSLLSQLVSVSKAAKRLNLCEGMVRYLADRGQLACVKIDGKRHFHPKDVEELRIEREVRQLMTNHQKRGPKRALRSVKFELAANVYSGGEEAVA